MIPRGCTCENSFSLPFNQEEIESLCITYKENEEIRLKKYLDDCIFKDGKIYVALSQEDTLKFDDNASIKIQIKIKLKDGTVTKSKKIETYTDEVFCNEVI